ncbi:glycerol-3-phosphate cytidylyltransferase [Bacillus sp. C1-1]|nr:glycerol-3-phosphate cytidylyltransferase [Bacillus sp. C1-1]
MSNIIGYTTGVFDMFHIGHLNILRKAREESDYLIVGVTSDELVKLRKDKYPVIPLEERMEIISHIDYVDQVVIQDTMDKFKAWELYKFNKMFVGDDWKGSPKWNKIEKDFLNIGVEIKYFPYTKHISSSKLREKTKL